MRTERIDPPARPEDGPPERENRDVRVRKERETKDDGRYIVFYDFEPDEGGEG